MPSEGPLRVQEQPRNSPNNIRPSDQKSDALTGRSASPGLLKFVGTKLGLKPHVATVFHR
jgi:hypothetical protein